MSRGLIIRLARDAGADFPLHYDGVTPFYVAGAVFLFAVIIIAAAADLGKAERGIERPGRPVVLGHLEKAGGSPPAAGSGEALLQQGAGNAEPLLARMHGERDDRSEGHTSELQSLMRHS